MNSNQKEFCFNGLKFSYEYGHEECSLIGYENEEPPSVLEIPSTAYDENSKPYIVKEIGANAFYGCKNITELRIPSSVKEIGDYSFLGCEGIRDITIPEGVEIVGKGAFHECKPLSISIPRSLKESKEYAFSVFSSSVEALNITDLSAWCNIDFKNKDSNPLYTAEHLVLNGKRITDLEIPEGVKEIKPYAFAKQEMKNFKTITIPKSMRKIGESAFSMDRVKIDCYLIIKDLNEWLKIDFENIDSNPMNVAHTIMTNNNICNELVIPEGIQELKAYVFCSPNVEVLTLPSSITKMDKNAFHNMALQSINIESLSWWLNVEYSGTLLHNGYHYITLYVNDKPLTNTLWIPEGISELRENAFYGYTKLSAIALPSTLKYIRKGSLYCTRTAILSYAKIPPEVESGYSIQSRGVTLYVPTGCKEAYESNYSWWDFEEIVDIL
ncbi:MAG: leucine-rich repeat protein [Bacteroidales bacterium]|nr:leucine-rich repeat protein [Bacteroidales bacterium]